MIDAPAAECRRGPILVVDDDRDLRTTLAELLDYDGYDVVEARHGSEALALLARARPRLILLDLSMPVMDGPTFRLHQLDDPAIADIPVAILSACGDIEERARSLRAAAVVPKPVQLTTLLEIVDGLCPR